MGTQDTRYQKNLLSHHNLTNPAHLLIPLFLPGKGLLCAQSQKRGVQVEVLLAAGLAASLGSPLLPILWPRT